MTKYQIDSRYTLLLSKLLWPADDIALISLVAEECGLPRVQVEEIFQRLMDSGILQTVSDSTSQPSGSNEHYGSLVNQRPMLADPVRNDAFLRAIHDVVKANDVVVEVGAGSGILSLFAARSGAKKVWALEASSIIDDARVVAETNGAGEVIEFVKGDAGKFNSKELADVVIAECIGAFLIAEWRHFAAFAKVRDLCLRPGGSVIPSRAYLLLSPISDERLYVDYGLGFWEEEICGLNFSLGRSRTLEDLRFVRVDARPDSIIGEPWEILNLDFMVDNSDAIYFESSSDMLFERTVTCHGYLGYFKVELAGDIVLDTSPFAPSTAWRQIYFPTNSFEIKAGDRLISRVNTVPSELTGYPRLTLDVAIKNGPTGHHIATYNYPIP